MRMKIFENENTGLFCDFFSFPAWFTQNGIFSRILVVFNEFIDPLPGYHKIIRYSWNRFSFLPLFDDSFDIPVR